MSAVNVDFVQVLLTVVGFLIVFVLNGIKSEIKDTKLALGMLESDLRKALQSLDRRITVVENRCCHPVPTPTGEA